MWNRTDPKSLGEIEDMKGWGGNTEDVQAAPLDVMLQTARDLLERGEARRAISHLCSIFIATDFNTPLQAVAWIDLARAFAACRESVLAFIAMREGARFPNLIGISDRAEKEELARFVDDPDLHLGRRPAYVVALAHPRRSGPERRPRRRVGPVGRRARRLILPRPGA